VANYQRSPEQSGHSLRNSRTKVAALFPFYSAKRVKAEITTKKRQKVGQQLKGSPRRRKAFLTEIKLGVSKIEQTI
jgi:hypothetical protein